MPPQIRQLRNAQIVIGTPGRVMDHMRRKTLSLQNLKTVILDEADEMLNMGFLEDIQTILEQTPETRQTVLFSATMPPAILNITKQFQKDPEMIVVDQGQKTVDGISQFYYHIPQDDKLNALKLLLEYHHPKKALVFCNTKKMVSELCENLNESGFETEALHGDLKQNQRSQVMSDFKNNRTKILIATDVAARGIDVEDVDAVFNYDIPQEDEFYIHRIGRTGRAGKTGASYTLAVSRSQLQRVHSLEKFMNRKIEEAPVPRIEDVRETRLKKFRGKIKQLVDENNGNEWFPFLEELEKAGYSAKNVAAALCEVLDEKNRRLASVKNVRKADQPSEGRGKACLNLNMGTKDKLKADIIVGSIVETTGLPISSIGKICIYNDHSTIELAPKDAELVLHKMNGYKMKQHAVHITLVGKKQHGQGMDKNGRKNDQRSSAKNRSNRYKHYGPKS